jgi:hypothetical protein
MENKQPIETMPTLQSEMINRIGKFKMFSQAIENIEVDDNIVAKLSLEFPEKQSQGTVAPKQAGGNSSRSSWTQIHERIQNNYEK